MKLSYLFSDGMVLQRGKRNYIWGETSPEIIVTGILDGRKFNTKADTHGMFVAELPDLPVGGPYCMEINGDEKRVIRNIMRCISSGRSVQYGIANKICNRAVCR